VRTLAVALLLALVGTPPAQAGEPAAYAVEETRGDAPGLIDLTRIEVEREGTRLLVSVHLRHFRADRINRGYAVWLDLDDTTTAPDYTMRWFSQEYGSGRTSGWHVVTSPQHPYGVGHARLRVRDDHFTFAVPARDLRGAEVVAVGASSQRWDRRGRVTARDHFVRRHALVPVDVP
jgi:hypothetical protein